MADRPAPIRSAVTGAPGAGKSTLLREVAKHGVAVGDEVARGILQAEGGMALRADDPQGFALAMLEAQLALWEAAPPNGGVIFYDRGFPDIAGFLRVEGLAVPTDVDRVCRTHRYNGPIFHAPAWREIYRQDEERIQTWDEAVASDEAICAAWRDYGYELVELPFAPPEERARFVMERLG